MENILPTIISGFQSGADIGAIKAALALSLRTGGFMPKGFKTENGNKPEYKQYGAIETSSSNYTQRTIENIKSSDVTIIFDFKKSIGSLNTRSYCIKFNKPCLYLNKDFNYLDIVEFLKKHNPSVINIAGNRESVSTGIEQTVYETMLKVLKIWKL
jgi:hypothetical protein